MRMLKNWPPFSEKEVLIGNPDAHIGVCTLWSPRELFVKKYLGDLMNNRIAITGNLYSVYGIGLLIRNLLSNPSIRYLIVSGTELGEGKKALIERLKSDLSIADVLFLDHGHITRFLEQVKIICVEPKDVIRAVTKEEFRDVSFEKENFEPLLVPMPEPQSKVFPGPQSGTSIRARTIKEAYIKLLKEIRLFGRFTAEDSEGHRRQELQNLSVVITEQDPFDFSSIPHSEYSEEHIKAYCEDFWSGRESGDLEYRYGHIIRHGFGDQVEAVVNAFKKKSETFRTVISLWNPDTVSGSIVDKDPPCIAMIQLRLTGDSLTLWARIRTNDMFGGWSLNAAALRYFQFMLLERLKKELNLPDLSLGEMETSSGSGHFYERDLLKVDSYLEKSRKRLKFFPDCKGNLEIKVENGEIAVNHFSPAGELLQTFHGKSAEKLSKELAPFISDIGNALYIGRELSLAEKEVNKDG